VPLINTPKHLSTLWEQLTQAIVNSNINITEELTTNKQQLNHYRCDAAGLSLDYSRHWVNEEILDLLLKLPELSQLRDKINHLFNGSVVNPTENRPALHTSLRSSETADAPQIDVINEGLIRLEKLCADIKSGKLRGANNTTITDVVNIGIGGSDLGPRMVNEALIPYNTGDVSVHFVANIDPNDIHDQLANLNPDNTLFVLASKSFSTQETLQNGQCAMQWLTQSGINSDQVSKHFIAITTNTEAAIKFGIREELILPLWQWVGGRYSLWSTIGLPIALANGTDVFRRLLKGAEAMDQHFRCSDWKDNAPVMLAIIEILYVNFFDSQSVAVIPYDQRLNNFPTYLQQLTMESNGKSCDLEGNTIGYETSPTIWGCAGSNGQHSFHQLFHQGTSLIPVDFILPLKSQNDLNNQHQLLVANCLSQSMALTQGKDLSTATQELLNQGLSQQQAESLAPHKVITGNKPHSIVSYESTTPEILGALIALYEHKVYTQSVIWNINAFDQWGVELGKQIGATVENALNGKAQAPDLIKNYVERFRQLNP
jgi:glucose-6-phosphate isomerase